MTPSKGSTEAGNQVMGLSVACSDAWAALQEVLSYFEVYYLQQYFGSTLKYQSALQEEVEEVQAKLTEAETTQNRSQLRETLRHLFNPVFLEALILTFIAGGASFPG